jgi:hypothetical protein
MSHNHDLNKISSKGWSKMSEVLDKEMPIERKKRVIPFFWIGISAVCLVAGLILGLQFSNSKVENNIVENGTSIINDPTTQITSKTNENIEVTQEGKLSDIPTQNNKSFSPALTTDINKKKSTSFISSPSVSNKANLSNEVSLNVESNSTMQKQQEQNIENRVFVNEMIFLNPLVKPFNLLEIPKKDLDLEEAITLRGIKIKPIISPLKFGLNINAIAHTNRYGISIGPSAEWSLNNNWSLVSYIEGYGITNERSTKDIKDLPQSFQQFSEKNTQVVIPRIQNNGGEYYYGTQWGIESSLGVKNKINKSIFVSSGVNYLFTSEELRFRYSSSNTTVNERIGSVNSHSFGVLAGLGFNVMKNTSLQVSSVLYFPFSSNPSNQGNVAPFRFRLGINTSF